MDDGSYRAMLERERHANMMRFPAPRILNLACGTDVRDGWVNLDVVEKWPLSIRGADIVWDARTDPIPFPDGSADGVYCGTLFLHLSPDHHARVLKDIYRVLRPNGGRVVISEVEMDEVMRRWIANPRDARLSELVFGEQGGGLNEEQLAMLSESEKRRQRDLSSFDKHCAGYTAATLKEFIESAGFKGARRIKVHGDVTWYECTFEAFR